MAGDTLTFYSEADIPRKWALTDVLYWVALKRLPVPMYDYYGNEHRESSSVLSEDIFSIGEALTPIMSPEESEMIGLEKDPDWINSERELRGEDYIHDEDHYLKMRDFEFPDEGAGTMYRDRHSEFMEQAREHKTYADKWEASLQEFLDPFYSQIHIELRNGNLSGEGIHTKNDDLDTVADRLYEKISSQKTFHKAFETVPKTYWILKNVKWKGSYLIFRDNFVASLRFNSKDVMEVFPPSSNTTVTGFKHGFHIFQTSRGAPKLANKRVGRPSKNWEAFHVEVAHRSKTNQLPAKQDAAAQDMKDWFESGLGQVVGLSTIKAKLKPYYDRGIIQKSEK